jgi:hypothetical protein
VTYISWRCVRVQSVLSRKEELNKGFLLAYILQNVKGMYAQRYALAYKIPNKNTSS